MSMKPLQVYEFVVEGEPVPWTVYTRRGPPTPGFLDMKAWQAQIQAAVIEKFGSPMLTGLIRMDVEFYRTMPGRHPRTPIAWTRRCMSQIGKRPDRTNILKAFEDALNGLLFMDDAQVVGGNTKKWFCPAGARPYTRAKVMAMERR